MGRNRLQSWDNSTQPRRDWATPVASSVLTVVVFAHGCGDPPSEPDAAMDSTAMGDADLAAPPQIPWLESGVPSLAITPCPDGHRLDEERQPAECDPYPVGGAESCDVGEAHFPGEPGCRPIGVACPSGELPEGLPTDGPVVYVSASAAPGGDGSRAAPLSALGDVRWASLPADAIVALGKGRYAGVLPLKAGVRVFGACVAETSVTGVDAPVRSVVSVTTSGDAPLVSNLTIADAPQPGAVADEGRSLRLEGVLISRVPDAGILTTRPGSSIVLRDVVVTDTLRVGSGRRGFGLVALLEGRIEGSRVLVSGSGEGGVLAGDEGSTIILSDSVISDTRGLPDGTFGRGVTAQGGGRVEGRRLLVHDNRDVGVIAGFDGELVLEDVVIRNTRSTGDGTSGRGISVQDGARLTADRVVVAESGDVGVFVSDPETIVSLRDVVVRDTLGTERDGQYGRAINVSGGAHVDAQRLVLLGSRDVALFVADPGSEAYVEDLLLADATVDRSDGSFGHGLAALNCAHLEVARALLERTENDAILGSGPGTTLRVDDVVIRETSHLDAMRSGGMGLAAQRSAQLTGSRVAISDVREHGVGAIGFAVLDLEDLSIDGVLESRLPIQPFGHGATAINATLRLTRFHIDEVEYCGVFLVAGDDPAELSVDLAQGEISNAAIGACVQAMDYDLSRLMQSVEYAGNDVNLDSTTLPVPEASPEPSEL